MNILSKPNFLHVWNTLWIKNKVFLTIAKSIQGAITTNYLLMLHATVEQATVGQQHAPPPTSTWAQQVLPGLRQKPNIHWNRGGLDRNMWAHVLKQNNTRATTWEGKFSTTAVPLKVGSEVKKRFSLKKGSGYSEAFLFLFFFSISLYHGGVYYFNRQSTCSVEQNKHIANFLWAKWKQSCTAKPWLIYYLELKLYY